MVDYSRWKNIEVSDDEDDTHPNIDTPSLFKWRHEARVQRMQEREEEQAAFSKRKAEIDKQKKELTEKQKEGSDVSKDMEKLTLQQAKVQEEEEELKKKDRLTPWNVDTIGKPGFSKTVINAAKPPTQEELTEEQKAERLQKFTTKYEKELQKFGMLRKYEDSKRFLQEYPELACEDTANYLTFWCIDLAIEEKHSLLNHVSHQAIAVQFLLELAKQTQRDPRQCSANFFDKMAHADQTEYKDGFDIELKLFQTRIRKRAEQKVNEALERQAEEDKAARIAASPGGLDFMEVLETLPESLRKCFEERDIPLLHKVIKELPIEEAEYHMRRCVDSGLWDPAGAKNATAENGENGVSGVCDDNGTEEESSPKSTNHVDEDNNAKAETLDSKSVPSSKTN